MKRIPEPELMSSEVQAKAYAQADFDAPHGELMRHFTGLAGDWIPDGPLADLGCGPADISVRLARLFPDAEIHGIDGASAMLQLARDRIARESLERRITLHECRLPRDPLPHHAYAGFISNSLLHHLQDPDVLWRTLLDFAAPHALVFVSDLMRPESKAIAQRMVARYSGDESEILRHDFFHSLRAAFTPDEVRAQLRRNRLPQLEVLTLSDRHLAVWGYL